MRFRYLTMGDIPECVRLFSEMQAEQRDTEPRYPQVTDHTGEEFMLALARQLVANPPNWFGVAGVVGSTVRDNPDGSKQVYGGKVKGFLTVSLNERAVGDPKLSAFCELLVVDEKFRRRDVARKLAHIGAVECARRGAQVLECSWNPNSLAAELGEKFGFRPYRVLAAFTTEDGTPRAELPIPKAEPAPEPRRRRRTAEPVEPNEAAD